MHWGDNEQLIRTLVQSAQLCQSIDDAIRFNSYQATPGAPDYAIANDGAVWRKQPVALSELRFFYAENQRTVDGCVEEIHRRLAMTPDERDAEAAGMTLADLMRVKQLHTSDAIAADLAATREQRRVTS